MTPDPDLVSSFRTTTKPPFKSPIGFVVSAVSLFIVASATAGLPAGQWRLFVTRTGESLSVYQDFLTCQQAAATQPKGTLGCKPNRATAEPTTADAAAATPTSIDPVAAAAEPVLPDVPTPPIAQPAVVVPPVMHAGLAVDLSALLVSVAGSAVERLQATSEVAPLSDIGAFRTVCDFSHMSFDDPIVYPGKPGVAHLHAFFGNTGTNANSTADSLRTTGNSTCRGGTVNRTAYWVPAMIDTSTGKAVRPDVAGIYYKRGYQLSTSTPIHPMPVGLRMIAGDPTRTAPDGTGARFRCLGGPNDSNDQYGSAIPNCDAGAAVIQEVFFPQCWDGKNLDAPDHKSHLSYPVQAAAPPWTWACPQTHPVALPQVGFNISYTVPTEGAAKAWRLASDTYDSKLPGGYSSHGDWFNGWKEDVSDSWARDCIAALRDCHSHLIGDGRMMY